MSTVITWSISKLECVSNVSEQDNYVVRAYWDCVGINGNQIETLCGVCTFDIEQKENFIKYENLTQDQVLDWCWNGNANESVNKLEIEQRIENHFDSYVVWPSLPWAK